jgi:hypothetical protein
MAKGSKGGKVVRGSDRPIRIVKKGRQVAMRKSAPVVEQLVRLAEVLAELHGGDPRDHAADAERLAQDLTPRVPITRDWANKPCIGWTDAERLLLALRRDAAQVVRERAEAVVEDFTPRLGGGIVAIELPGREPIRSPHLVLNESNGKMQVPG